MTTLADVDNANLVLQADPKAARSTKAYAAAVTAYLHAQEPPPAVAAGVGLYQLGGSLVLCSHLYDGTYETVIGDWDDADLLVHVSGKGFVYTVTAATAPGWTLTPVLDVANPGKYVDAVVAHQAFYGYRGVFLDNCIGTIPGLLGALQFVSGALRTRGVLFAANVGSFVPGNPGSDDGTLWMEWATVVAPYLDYAMLENWQQFSGGTLLGQLRTIAPGGHWDGWQWCPGSVPATRFMGCTYGPPAGNAVYGRASMLTAPDVKPDAVFVYSTPQADPYDAVWTKRDPAPAVNPTAGTASL